MPPPNLHVIGIDPGKTTGWYLISAPRAAFYGTAASEILAADGGEFHGPEDQQTLEICRLARQIQDLDFAVGPALVVEDFDIPPHAPTTDKELLSPVRIAAKLKYAAFRGDLGPDINVVLQSRTIAKSTATDDRLKAWGLYVASSDHIRDASRHAITALRRAKDKPEFRDRLWKSPTRRNAGRTENSFESAANGRTGV